MKIFIIPIKIQPQIYPLRCCYIAMFAKIWKWVCWILIINGVEQIQHTYYCIMYFLFSTHFRNNMTLATWYFILNRFDTAIYYCSNDLIPFWYSKYNIQQWKHMNNSINVNSTQFPFVYFCVHIEFFWQKINTHIQSKMEKGTGRWKWQTSPCIILARV